MALSRFFRSFTVNVGLALALIGILAALWLARDFIAMMLTVSWLRYRGEGGVEVARMNLSGFVLAMFFALVGFGVMIVGVVRVRRGAM